jgi:hypothetical protein
MEYVSRLKPLIGKVFRVTFRTEKDSPLFRTVVFRAIGVRVDADALGDYREKVQAKVLHQYGTDGNPFSDVTWLSCYNPERVLESELTGAELTLALLES